MHSVLLERIRPAGASATASDGGGARRSRSNARRAQSSAGRLAAGPALLGRTVRRLAARAALIVALVGCSRSAPNATPEGAAREFVERAATFEGNPDHAEALLRLLSARARQNLQVRADRYGAASGRTIDPAAMLVPSRLTLRFAPRSYHATIAGGHATVEVRGAGPPERAEIPCVLEDGLWYVDLPLPELPPMRKREGDEP